MFVRPHELELHRVPDGRPFFRARVLKIQSAGPSVKIELASDDGQSLVAETTHDRLQELALACGDEICVSPRRSRIFHEDYAI
jgi:sulfate/thiosulfate transport system ATP-binding protein